MNDALSPSITPEEEHEVQEFEDIATENGANMLKYRDEAFSSYRNQPEGLYTSWEQYKEENDVDEMLTPYQVKIDRALLDLNSTVNSESYDIVTAQYVVARGVMLWFLASRLFFDIFLRLIVREAVV